MKRLSFPAFVHPVRRSAWLLGLIVLLSGPEGAAAPAASPAAAPSNRDWKTLLLTPYFWAEGVCVGDVDHDGRVDLLSGPYWHAGPDFKKQRPIYPDANSFVTAVPGTAPKTIPGFEGWLSGRNGYSNNFLSFASDLNGDGWVDYVVIDYPGKPSHWFENPRGEEKLWAQHPIIDSTDNESPVLADLDGDRVPELLCMSNQQLGYAKIDPKNPAEKWSWHPVSPVDPRFKKFTHGLGYGDLNGDGRLDVIEGAGWWEQPVVLDAGPWVYHPADFGNGAQILAYDVNGDGRTDVITSLVAHGYGLCWFEQAAAGSTPTWIKHTLTGATPAEGSTGVVFSQIHALALADVNGDGRQDIVTGKRFWAHGPAGDPEPNAPAVLYWFELQRKDGQVTYVPHLVDEQSGVGTQVVAADVNGDKKIDLVAGTKRGLFVHLQSPVVPGGSRRGDFPDAKPTTPQEQRALFHLPDGFEIQLVADESRIQKPMNLNFDAAGRLWVTGSELYPFAAQQDALGRRITSWDQEWNAMGGRIDANKPTPPPAPIDAVYVLDDFGPDGAARRVRTFADKLNIPIGVLPLPRRPGAKGDTVIVYSIPGIWRMEDTDGDGTADKRELIYSGFGFKDTHGMSSNYLLWLDGWIYGCHGFMNRSDVTDVNGKVTTLESGNTYRFKPDGSRFEIFTHGQTNPFGLSVDPLGNFFTADSHSKPVYFLVPGGFYEGIQKKHDGLGFAPAITNDDHGSSAIAGIAYYADDTFPEEYRRNVFIGNVVTNTVTRDRFEWHGATPQAVRMPDFITCDDPWFRPVQVKLGPDGALYIADFYVPIIGHYEHPLLDPRRDHKHGRIWRVTWRGKGDRPDTRPVDLTRLDEAQLIAGLGQTNLTARALTINELVARGRTEALQALFKGPGDPIRRASALWALERLGALRREWIIDSLRSGELELNVQAVRVLAERATLPAEDLAELRGRLEGAPPLLQLAIVEALAKHPAKTNLAALVATAARIDGQDDRELEYAIRVALREQLQFPESFAELTRPTGDRGQNPALATTAPVLLADVALAVPGVASADFLFQQLKRLNYQVPRVGEYLSHVGTHLPPERLNEIAEAAVQVKQAPLNQRIAVAVFLDRAVRERDLKVSEETRRWVNATLLAGVASTETAAAYAAIMALKTSTNEAKVAPLSRVVHLINAPALNRAMALEAMANLPASRPVLVQMLRDSSWGLQVIAAQIVNRRGDTGLAREALPEAPARTAGLLAMTLAAGDASAAELLELIEQGKVSATVLRQAPVAEAFTHRPAALQEKLTRLTAGLLLENARLDAVIASRTAFFRQSPPELLRGREVFQQNCMACHKFRDEGGSLAPNLDGVSARGPERLAEDILDPNRNVDASFRQTTVVLNNGQSVAGTNLRETALQLTVLEAGGGDRTIPRSEIKSSSTSPLSLMPPSFESVLSDKDFAALLSYLLNK